MKKLIEKVYEGNSEINELEDLFYESIEKTYSPRELVEVLNYIKNKQAIIIDLPDSVDVCGTGGSGLDRINTSTLSAVKLARSGVGIAKNGNKAASGRFGSFDLLEQLDYIIPENAAEVQSEYDTNNLAFLLFFDFALSKCMIVAK